MTDSTYVLLLQQLLNFVIVISLILMYILLIRSIRSSLSNLDGSHLLMVLPSLTYFNFANSKIDLLDPPIYHISSNKRPQHLNFEKNEKI